MRKAFSKNGLKPFVKRDGPLKSGRPVGDRRF